MFKRLLAAAALTACLSYAERARADTTTPHPVCGSNGLPCRCAPGPGFASRETTAMIVSAYSTVFEGTVVRVLFATDSAEFRVGSEKALRGYRMHDLVVTIAVTRRWKGGEGDTITVRTSASTTECGADFDMGETYLVFARSWDAKYIGPGAAAHVGEVVRTTKCSPTIVATRMEARRIMALLEPR
jgi:hypothetical protein